MPILEKKLKSVTKGMFWGTVLINIYKSLGNSYIRHTSLGIIFEYILHISTPHIMIFCFPLPYFPLSTSALFFA